MDCLVEEYERTVQRRSTLNKRIVQKTDRFIRFMTFNVHGFTNIYHKDTRSDIFSLIRKLKPDFIGLQEAEGVEQFDEQQYQLFTLPMNEVYNAFITNIPFHNTISIQSNQRNFLFTTIYIHNIEIVIGVIHLDYKSRKNRFKEIKQLSEYINLKYSETVPMILMGDFNSIQSKDYNNDRIEKFHSEKKEYVDFDSIEYFHRSTNYSFQEAFDETKCDVSVWSNRRVDYIFYRNLEQFKVRPFVYYTLSSDHLPLIVDLYPRSVE